MPLSNLVATNQENLQSADSEDFSSNDLLSSDSDESSSDDEPLSKYVKPDKAKKKTQPSDVGNVPKVGRSRGPTKPQQDFSKRPKPLCHYKVCRDRVDEEFARWGIVYKYWQALDPDQTSHVTVREFGDDTIIPENQPVPQWCIICPKNSFLRNQRIAHHHYHYWHHSRMLVIRNTKLWACKCSKMRSHGSDNLARNQHYHCLACFHPFKTGDLLATHIVMQHKEYTIWELRHLMKDSNLHKLPY